MIRPIQNQVPLLWYTLTFYTDWLCQMISYTWMIFTCYAHFTSLRHLSGQTVSSPLMLMMQSNINLALPCLIDSAISYTYRCSVTIQARVTYAHGCSESLYRFRCNESGHDNYIRKYGVHSMQCYRKEPMNFFLHPLKIWQNCYRK